MAAEQSQTSPAPLPARLEALAANRFATLAEAAETRGVALPGPESLPGDAVRVWACSEYVATCCSREPGMLADLIASGDLASSYPGPAPDPDPLAATRAHLVERLRPQVQAAADQAALMRVLRLARRREWVRIAWRDIGRLANFEEILRDTSAMADAVVDLATDWLHADQRERLGDPVDEDGSPQRLTVFALGKLGAGELNFSSDVDLIFGYARAGETVGKRRSLTNEEYFTRLGRALIKTLGERTAEGIAFRVDMRLRPFGASGPLVTSFGALEDYYQSHGRDWERYALVRARPVAGDVPAALELLEHLRPFVYRRYLDFGTLESLRDMKQLMTDEVERRGLQNDVKLGPGGIRELEFTGQAFQMVRGGRIPELRDRRILRVLQRLGELDFLPAYAVDQLTSAYRFLRDSEHRIQQMEDRQLHVLPADEPTRELLAAGMGYADWHTFHEALSRHRERVNAQFVQVFGVPDEPEADSPEEPLEALAVRGMDAEHALGLLADAGFEDVEAAWRSLEGFLDSYAVRLIDERGRRRLQRMLPDLLRAVAAQPEPEATLGRVMAILETIARRSAYVALLRERPLALSQLVRLCAASPWIARQIRGHPVLLDELLDPRTLYAPLEPAALELDLTARLGNAPAGDEEQELEILRQFKHANVLRVAAADVARALPLMVVSDHLTEIAEALLRRVLHLAWRDVAARYGRPGSLPEGPQGAHGFGIIAYGKLGGIELGYGSDLDLVFVHAGAGRGSLTTGPTQVDDEVFYRRLGQRIIHLLTARMSSGVLYEVDSRLRPSGVKGELVNGIEGLGRYLRNDAWTWEHQALVRARMLAGDRNLRARFDDLRRDILLVPRDPDTLRTEVREMRARMRAHLGSGETPGFDLKQDPGGIADIEFMVQYATLRWADRLGDYAKFTDNIRLLEGLARAGLVAPEDTRALTDAYRAYRARVHAQALQEQGGAVPEADFEAHRDEVVRIWNRLMED